MALDVTTIKIEFVLDYKKEYNNFNRNINYSFAPLHNLECQSHKHSNVPCGIYPKVEFYRKNIIGYIKLKNKEVWLYDTGFFPLKPNTLTQTATQPLSCWFEYVSDTQFVVYKYISFGETAFLIYDDNTLSINWTADLNLATNFQFQITKPYDYSWIKLTPNNITSSM